MKSDKIDQFADAQSAATTKVQAFKAYLHSKAGKLI